MKYRCIRECFHNGFYYNRGDEVVFDEKNPPPQDAKGKLRHFVAVSEGPDPSEDPTQEDVKNGGGDSDPAADSESAPDDSGEKSGSTKPADPPKPALKSAAPGAKK